jgi:hypothetical protein
MPERPVSFALQRGMLQMRNQPLQLQELQSSISRRAVEDIRDA